MNEENNKFSKQIIIWLVIVFKGFTSFHYFLLCRPYHSILFNAHLLPLERPRIELAQVMNRESKTRPVQVQFWRRPEHRILISRQGMKQTRKVCGLVAECQLDPVCRVIWSAVAWSVPERLRLIQYSFDAFSLLFVIAQIPVNKS